MVLHLVQKPDPERWPKKALAGADGPTAGPWKVVAMQVVDDDSVTTASLSAGVPRRGVRIQMWKLGKMQHPACTEVHAFNCLPPGPIEEWKELGETCWLQLSPSGGSLYVFAGQYVWTHPTDASA